MGGIVHDFMHVTSQYLPRGAESNHERFQSM